MKAKNKHTTDSEYYNTIATAMAKVMFPDKTNISRTRRIYESVTLRIKYAASRIIGRGR